MPKIEQEIADVNVRAHTFKFITPKDTESLKIPNPCGTCHADKPATWAADTFADLGECVAVASCESLTNKAAPFL